MLVGVGRLIEVKSGMTFRVVPMLVGVGRVVGSVINNPLEVVPMLVGVGRLHSSGTRHHPRVVPMLVGVGRDLAELGNAYTLLSPCSWGWAVFRIQMEFFQ